VATRRLQAARMLLKMQKKGQACSPVVIAGRAIASSFWGKSWCTNLERYSDYANRLPRGRTYARNGSVVDLKITRGEVAAMVSGSSLYKIKISISPVTRPRWQAICRDCSGSIDSLVELLQGRLSRNVMDRVCRQGDGLFPTPREIKLSCSCPDWAEMCKHVAAALYGVGARLDERPELLFVLRGVDEKDLIAGAGMDLTSGRLRVAKKKVLADDDVAALFGMDMAEMGETGAPSAGTQTAPAERGRESKSAVGTTAKATPKKPARARTVMPPPKRSASRSSTGRGKMVRAGRYPKLTGRSPRADS
jgi:uncharacterized Zn finger protein